MRTAAMRTGALTAALLVPLAGVVDLHDPPPPVTVVVGGTPRYVHRNTTFGQALREFHVHAASGRLLDVQGGVLDANADPGRVLLNGSVADPPVRLADGDRIVAVNGVDRTEGTRDVVTRLKGRRPGDPQYTLGTARAEKITTEGKISGLLKSFDVAALHLHAGDRPVHSPLLASDDPGSIRSLGPGVEVRFPAGGRRMVA